MADLPYLNLLVRPDACRKNYPGRREVVFRVVLFSFNARMGNARRQGKTRSRGGRMPEKKRT
jgi:hypothetical protein